MDIKKMVLLITIFNAMTFAARAEDHGIPMVGVKENGSPIEIVVPKNVYSERVKAALTEVESSTLVALAKTAQTQNNSSWYLRSVVVGLGLNMEVKLGPIIKFGALPRFRVGFSNAKEPSIP